MSFTRSVARTAIGYGLRRHSRANGLMASFLILRFARRRLRSSNRVLLRFKVEPGTRYEIVGIRRGG
ncbi:MAG: hypothetical protein RL531_158 [Actinomycetota bacterium]|jgi:hypothetical protein